jgi:TPR repeat protein
MMMSLRKIGLLALSMILMSAVVVVRLLHRETVIERRRLTDAADQCRRLAEQGDANREFELAGMYVDGKGVTKDYAEALQWYRKAAEQGHVKAQFYLGEMYLRGQGTSEDYTEALQWIQKAAKQNDPRAEAALGYIYYNGKGVPRNYDEAANWYRKASDQGYALAQQSLAYMYYNGEGVPQDYASAVRWYRKAADQGDAAAEEGLGYMYATGRGVPRDPNEAVAWYRQAARQGDVRAKQALQPLETGRLMTTRNSELLVALMGFPVALLLLFRGRKLKSGLHWALAVLGATFLFNAGLSVYAFVHDNVHFGPYRDAFDTTRRFLNGTAILALLSAILLSNRKNHNTAPEARRR